MLLLDVAFPSPFLPERTAAPDTFYFHSRRQAARSPRPCRQVAGPCCGERPGPCWAAPGEQGPSHSPRSFCGRDTESGSGPLGRSPTPVTVQWNIRFKLNQCLPETDKESMKKETTQRTGRVQPSQGNPNQATRQLQGRPLGTVKAQWQLKSHRAWLVRAGRVFALQHCCPSSSASHCHLQANLLTFAHTAPNPA